MPRRRRPQVHTRGRTDVFARNLAEALAMNDDEETTAAPRTRAASAMRVLLFVLSVAPMLRPQLQRI